MTHERKTTIRILRRMTLTVLIAAPIISYCIPAGTTLGWFTLTDLTEDFSGVVSFLFILFNPYVGMAIVVATLGRSTARCSVLLIASILIAGAGVYLWYDLLVRDASVMSFFVLLGVGALQWWGIIATAIICMIIWAVERRLARRQSAATLFVCALLLTACGDVSPVSETPPTIATEESAGVVELAPQSIVKDLPWNFSTTIDHSLTTDTTTILVRSIEPIEASDAGNVYLRASLSNQSFETPQLAAEAFANRCAEAHPDTGLTYAWDLVIQRQAHLLHLHADCLFSEQAFDIMSSNLFDAVNQTPHAILRCRCGSGCETVDLDGF